MCRKFNETKKFRAKYLGWRCELCGSGDKVIGHHILGRRHPKANDWRFCQLRCLKCEENNHTGNEHGNTKFSTKVQFAHNDIIAKKIDEEIRGALGG